MISFKNFNFRSAKIKSENMGSSEHRASMMAHPQAKGLKKVILLGKVFYEVIQNGIEEKEVTEIPVIDTAKYGEIVSFMRPEHFDVVEQIWISEGSAMVTILNNKQTRKNMYFVSEPMLTPFEAVLLQKLYNDLKIILLENINVELNHRNKELVLYNNFIKILSIYDIQPDPNSLQKIWYYLRRNYVGYGKLDVLLKIL